MLHVRHAAAAINEGLCKTVLITHGESGRSRVGAGGFAYEEAAEICGCAVGTMKSRVNRARNRLATLLSVGGDDEFGPDAQWQAGIDAGSRIAVGE